MGLAVEAKVGGLYMNALELSPMRTTLKELDHLQPSTSIRTDNSTADGIMNKKIKKKLMDKNSTSYKAESSKENSEYSGPQGENLAYYYTKYHSPATHNRLRPIYISIESKSPATLQGCVVILTHG